MHNHNFSILILPVRWQFIQRVFLLLLFEGFYIIAIDIDRCHALSISFIIVYHHINNMLVWGGGVRRIVMVWQRPPCNVYSMDYIMIKGVSMSMRNGDRLKYRAADVNLMIEKLQKPFIHSRARTHTSSQTTTSHQNK